MSSFCSLTPAYSTPGATTPNRFVGIGSRDNNFLNIPQQTQVRGRERVPGVRARTQVFLPLPQLQAASACICVSRWNIRRVCLFSSCASCTFFRAASRPIASAQRLLLSRASSILSFSVMLHLFHLVLHLTCAVYVKPHPPAFRSPLPRNIWKQSQTAWSPLPPLSPCLLYIYDTPFSILPVLQPYFASLFIFNSVSLPLALALPLLRAYGAITLPPFVITGMFTLFPLAYSRSSALRKWKSVWALRSDSLRVLINPLGVRSDVEVSFLTETMDNFSMDHRHSEIDLEVDDH